MTFAVRPAPSSNHRDDATAAQLTAVVAPGVALLLGGLAILLGWQGVDVAASVHRILEFQRDGYALWDPSWYGGQWMLDYSVAFAPVAATVGLHALGLVAGAVSTLSFERMARRHFGPPAVLAAAVFAVGTVVEAAIGQLPFLSGQAFALGALWAATRRHYAIAWLLAAGATLLSPLAGAFAAFAAIVWLFATWASRSRRSRLAVAGIAIAAAVPLLATTLLFPGEGQMPFTGTDLGWDLCIAAIVGAVAPRRERVLRIGVLAYASALVASYLVASPIGGNAGRLGDCLALPLVTAVLWDRRRLLLAALAVPLAATGWGAAWGAVTSLPSQASTTRAFYAPLDRWLTAAEAAGRRGRVEVVPTLSHWESVWVAGVAPLARGWERQSDVSANALFYRPGALTAASYRSWLLDNGVTYVALPAAPLDYAGRTEAALLASTVDGLRPVWHDRDWRVWAVTGSSGLVSGPASVLDVGGSRLTVRVSRPGAVTVRVSAESSWAVTEGDACAAPETRWTRLEVRRPGVITLEVALGASRGRCRS